MRAPLLIVEVIRMRKGTGLLLTAFLLLTPGRLADGAEDVVISEFMALNDAFLGDEDGNHRDWVELYNNGATTVDLAGWYLTDNPENLTKWVFN